MYICVKCRYISFASMCARVSFTFFIRLVSNRFSWKSIGISTTWILQMVGPIQHHGSMLDDPVDTVVVTP